MKHLLFVCIIGAGLLAVTPATSAFSQAANGQSVPVNVGAINVLANPQKYNGLRIRLIGLASVEFESHALYFHKEDFQYGNNKNAFWLRLSDEQSKRYAKLDLKYTIIEGIFHADGPERTEYGGAIGEITRFEYWRPLFETPTAPKISNSGRK